MSGAGWAFALWLGLNVAVLGLLFVVGIVGEYEAWKEKRGRETELDAEADELTIDCTQSDIDVHMSALERRQAEPFDWLEHDTPKCPGSWELDVGEVVPLGGMMPVIWQRCNVCGSSYEDTPENRVLAARHASIGTRLHLAMAEVLAREIRP